MTFTKTASSGERKNSMTDCLFCKIASGEIPSKFVYEDDLCCAFNDIDPQAPVHILIIPKKHIDSLSAAEGTDAQLLAHLLLTAKKIAKEQGLEEGYRLVINSGDFGGQSVKHLHLHLLGKKPMGWPPYAF